MQTKQKDKTLFVSTVILIIFHLVGIIGIHSSYKELFLQLTPFNLLLSCTLLFINQKQFNRSFFIVCFIIYVSGFLVELIGVKSGVIFGNYQYGDTLGLKLFDIPLIIGINWLILIYSAGCISNRLNSNIFVKSIKGAAMLVALDLLIEPVAIKYNFWQWSNSAIPTQNYVAWFVIGFCFLLIFNKFDFNKNNKLAQTLYIIELVFFALLNIL